MKTLENITENINQVEEAPVVIGHITINNSDNNCIDDGTRRIDLSVVKQQMIRLLR